MYPSLMGTFSCPAPILMIGSSFGGVSSSLNSISFHATHMEDPWILPSSSTSSVPVETNVPFPVTMVVYQANIDQVAEPSPSSSWTEKEDLSVLPIWAVESSHSYDCLNDFFPSDEAILEAMSGIEQPWEELHRDGVSFLSLIV